MTAVEAAAPALRLRDVWKAYGACVANRGVDLEVARGEIHAVVGENGAGKSTLMRLIAGIERPDHGTIEVFGKDVTGWTAAQAIDAGVGMVHQHFMLVPTLTVAENVVLGREPHRGFVLDLGRAERDVGALVAQSGLAVAADARIDELPVGIAQRVEILKVLHRGAKLLILDEPTAVLSPPEVHDLVGVLEKLRDGGATIVIITHKLAEVMRVSSRVTVIRRGETVGRLETAKTTPEEIARAMVGRDVAMPLEHDGPAREAISGSAPVLLSVRDLAVDGSQGTRAVDGLSFEVRAGEVLGIAGVEGNGQTELVEALAGLRRAARGSISLGGRDITRASVRERIQLGLAHIPEDRHRRGLVLDLTVAENLVLGRHDRFTKRGVLVSAAIDAHAATRIRDFDIRPADASSPARALSGGNQQKVVIAREMGSDFEVLLAAQPTRGVDIGAIEFIHARILDARARNKAVVLVSAELSEILALADRVAVLFRGRFVATMPRSEASTAVLGPFMTGAAGRPLAEVSP